MAERLYTEHLFNKNKKFESSSVPGWIERSRDTCCRLLIQ